MSYTTVKALWPGEKTEDFEELRNSHGSATIVWNVMCKKYYGAREHGWNEFIDKLWPRWKDLSIPEHQRAVLMMTYDRAYVTRENYSRMARDIGKFLEDFDINPEYVNHWPRIKTIFESNPDCPAIGLWCTSVSEDPFQGEWDEDKEDYDPINWDSCYDIYQEIYLLTTTETVHETSEETK